MVEFTFVSLTAPSHIGTIIYKFSAYLWVQKFTLLLLAFGHLAREPMPTCTFQKVSAVSGAIAETKEDSPQAVKPESDFFFLLAIPR